ncbi:hypothetical protein L195_g017861 [Trifolium pratense]|uniref:Uncharacterized protein n=1 Tax=Trifolium pratense TaxID=57577 RepID=A0A2K3MV23_TRIPR|nr:hypothetical protein L195_g017861 [Trifolium pratense]
MRRRRKRRPAVREEWWVSLIWRSICRRRDVGRWFYGDGVWRKKVVAWWDKGAADVVVLSEGEEVKIKAPMMLLL